MKTNRIADALAIYGQILTLCPGDVDALIVLGDAFLVAEDRKTAVALYQRANKFSPANREVKKRISILQPSDVSDVPELPGIPDLVLTITQKLTGVYQEVSENEIRKARSLLDNIIKHESPAQAVAENLQEIEKLLPALIEINLRQAKSEGKLDIVVALESLKGEIIRQNGQGHAGDHPAATVKSRSKAARKVLLVGPSSVESPFRQAQLARGLHRIGCEVVTAGERDAWMSWEAFDLVIVQNPHASPELMRDFAGFYASGKPVVLDLSADFEIMSDQHPEAGAFGLRDAERRRSYFGALHLADLILVNNFEFASNLEKSCLPVEFVPDAWDHENALWYEPVKPRRSLNLGLACLPDQMEDVVEIRRSLARIIREFPHTRLIVSGDLNVYQLFDTIPDDRKLFLPFMTGDEYPFMFTHMDIMLVPLRETYFNHLRSDGRLVESGVRKIPWVASSLHFVSNWQKGGLIAHNPDEWYQHLKSMIVDETLRTRLGEQGFQKAQERKAVNVCKSLNQRFDRIFSQDKRSKTIMKENY